MFGLKESGLKISRRPQEKIDVALLKTGGEDS